jgi:hypothetical protein
MFSFKMADLLGGEKLPKAYPFDGGWTTERSFDGLARRILHAVMTEDQFTLVMTGHSLVSPPGHGNHLQQGIIPCYNFKRPWNPYLPESASSVTRNMGMGHGTIKTPGGW